jgi:predicted nucleic acid-binding Zn ribbon protein|tara:strand:- start:1384 stop:1707 length:324 start_codon:yes stop_codon:yes gene_type:complete
VKVLAMRKSEKGRKGQPESLGDAIQEMLKSFRIEEKFNEANLVNSWEKIMGAPIAKRTTKVYIRDKKLFVHINSAPLKHELSMSRDKILVLIARELGSSIVNEVIIK